MRHTPTTIEIKAVVSEIFKTTVEAIESKSRKMDAVIPREVCVYLMSIRGAMDIPTISKETGYDSKSAHKCIRKVRGWIRTDSDFAFRVWESEKRIMGITEKYRVSNP